MYIVIVIRTLISVIYGNGNSVPIWYEVYQHVTFTTREIFSQGCGGFGMGEVNVVGYVL